MSKPQIVITAAGIEGEKLLQKLNKYKLPDVLIKNCTELARIKQENIFILFLLHIPTEDGNKMENIKNVFSNACIIEIVWSEHYKSSLPHYLINDYSLAETEIIKLMETFNDLGKFPTQSNIDILDVQYSLKNASRLQVKELRLDDKGKRYFSNKACDFLQAYEELKVVWVQIYLSSHDDSLSTILCCLVDNLQEKIHKDIAILWNASYVDSNSSKCVLLYC